jgi:hypothetical protein
MLALLLALALQGTDDQAAADGAARLLRAAHPKQVDLGANTYAGRCLTAVVPLAIGGGRELLLVATRDADKKRGCDPQPLPRGHAWRLELVEGTPARAKLVSALEVGKDPGSGGVQAQLARVAEKPFLVEVDWGLSNESDGSCAAREVWRIRDTRLERLLGFGSCHAEESGGGDSGFAAARPAAGEVRIEAWSEQDWLGEEEPAWSTRTTGTYVVGENAVRVLRALATPSASSTLPPSKAGDYRPERAVDGDPKTAWCEGALGPGVGQSLTLSFNPPMAVTALTILPGYGKSPEVFQANARPRRVRIEAGTAPAVERELRDAFESQRLELVAGPPTASVRTTVLSVWPGGRFEDMCISEILAEGRF